MNEPSRFWSLINPADHWLIRKINLDWSHPVLDTILPFFRETGFWFPLYLLLITFVSINFGVKGFWWIIGFLLSAALADIVSTQLIKETVLRARPCQDPSVGPDLRFFISYCPGNSSFTSSHATTHFAVAMFFYITLRSVFRQSWVFFIWAFLVAYTQVYVGVHYPSDVICGGIVGIGIGFMISKMFLKQVGMLSFDK